MKMTLSRALRYKKRVIEEIRKAEQAVQAYNSVVEVEGRECDIRAEIENRKKWVSHLLNLKVAVIAATAPIQKMVLELAEAKSEISYVSKINTLHGKQQARFRDDVSISYEAVVRKKEQAEWISSLQVKIDDLQTKIDAHNATTEIEIPDVER